MAATKICPQCGREESLEVRFCPVDGTALRLTGAAESDLVGQIVGDRYHVLRKLGEGGMGQVYLVEHVKMQRKSALKVMNPGMVKDADAISRFNREAANASRINHPNVASVYDFGETPDGLIFLAMEFVDGPALTKVIEEQGALAPARAADIIRQAADALAVAHDMGIVHRDLKPDNIMVAKTRDGADLVKVVDFGIAKAQDSGAQKVTKTGMVVGTPEYMSPEQLAGDKLDGRSDIYSLGLVAFNMLTGTLPFPSDSQQESMIMRLTDKPKPLGAMKADVNWPADVQAVMDKVLERDASLRYQNASDFGRALVAAVERMPATAIGAAGTMVIGSAGLGLGSPPPSPGAPTAAVPATRVASAAETASPVSAPSHGGPVTPKSKMPMIAVAAVVIVLIGGFGAYKAMSGKAGAAPPTQTNSQTSSPPGTPAGPSQQSAGSQQQPIAAPNTNPSTPVNSAAPPAKAPATQAATGSPGGAMNPTKLKAILDSMEKVTESDSKTDAQRVLTDIEKYSDYINTTPLIVQKAVIQATALLTLGETDRACSILRVVKDQALNSKYLRTVTTTLASCPPGLF